MEFRGGFKVDVNNLIVRYLLNYNIEGTKWSTIARSLTQRTENAVKNRYKSLFKKEIKE
jgi:hypothetical protein